MKIFITIKRNQFAEGSNPTLLLFWIALPDFFMLSFLPPFMIYKELNLLSLDDLFNSELIFIC